MGKDFTNRPFDKLKKRIEKANTPSPPPSPSVPEPATDEDLFSDAMSDVLEIPEFRVLPCRRAPRHAVPSGAPKRDPDADALDLLVQIAKGAHPVNLSETQEYVEWTNPAARAGLTAELHRGRFAVQAMLDLHGVTAEDVNDEIDLFLGEVFRRGWRCVKIIHGRGLRSVKGPVLKDAVIRRLLGQYRKRVISFVSARQCDGGLGAMYVLLR